MQAHWEEWHYIARKCAFPRNMTWLNQVIFLCQTVKRMINKDAKNRDIESLYTCEKLVHSILMVLNDEARLCHEHNPDSF